MTLATDIRKLKMFAELTNEECEALSTTAERRELPDDTLVFREGDTTREFYVVESGRVAIEVELHQGRRLQVTSIEPGQGFGWSGLLPEEVMTATARTTEPTTVIAFDVAQIDPLIKLDYHLGYVLLRAMVGMMSQRIRQTRMQLAQCYYG